MRPAREAGAGTDVPEPNSSGFRSVLPHTLTHRMLPALMHDIAVCSDGRSRGRGAGMRVSRVLSATGTKACMQRLQTLGQAGTHEVTQNGTTKAVKMSVGSVCSRNWMGGGFTGRARGGGVSSNGQAHVEKTGSMIATVSCAFVREQAGKKACWSRTAESVEYCWHSMEPWGRMEL